METVMILDERDEPAQARLEMRGRRVIAVKEDGIILFPGAFMVLDAEEVALVRRAVERG